MNIQILAGSVQPSSIYFTVDLSPVYQFLFISLVASVLFYFCRFVTSVPISVNYPCRQCTLLFLYLDRCNGWAVQCATSHISCHKSTISFFRNVHQPPQQHRDKDVHEHQPRQEHQHEQEESR